MMIPKARRLVVVVGCQRSGTTLTGQLLGEHSGAVLLDEPDGLYPWFHAMASRRAEADALAAAVLERALTKYRSDDRFVRAGGSVDARSLACWRRELSPEVAADVMRLGEPLAGSFGHA